MIAGDAHVDPSRVPGHDIGKGRGDTPRVLLPLTEAINRLALSAPAVWVVGIAGSHDQKAGL